MPTDCPTCADLLDRVRKLEAQVAWMRDRPGVKVSPNANIRTIPKRLTPPEVATLRAIRRYWRDHGCGPRMKDLGARLGISMQAAHERVKRLVERGLVSRDPKLHRSVRVLYDPDAQGVA